MELILAGNLLGQKGEAISLAELEKRTGSEGGFFYFDRENSKKNMDALAKHFEKLGRSVYKRQLKYSLAEGDFVYEVHIL